jgi:mono/diheme cytochrome c family protein
MWGKGSSAGRVWVTIGVMGAAAVAGCAAFSDGGGQGESQSATASSASHVAAASSEAAGKYLVRIGGCNDCHTPGYSESGGNVAVAQWLTGVPVGFRGPWGTTYASNLRLYIDPMSEDDWVRVIRARNDKPPMPWEALHAMSDPDLRAIYRFIKPLGKAGAPTPQDVPPGQEPKTPFVVMAPPTMPKE